MIDIKELRRLAEQILKVKSDYIVYQEQLSAYHAAANPATVITLLDELEHYQECLKVLRQEIDDLSKQAFEEVKDDLPRVTRAIAKRTKELDERAKLIELLKTCDDFFNSNRTEVGIEQVYDAFKACADIQIESEG